MSGGLHATCDSSNNRLQAEAIRWSQCITLSDMRTCSMGSMKGSHLNLTPNWFCLAIDNSEFSRFRCQKHGRFSKVTDIFTETQSLFWLFCTNGPEKTCCWHCGGAAVLSELLVLCARASIPPGTLNRPKIAHKMFSHWMFHVFRNCLEREIQPRSIESHEHKNTWFSVYIWKINKPKWCAQTSFTSVS